MGKEIVPYVHHGEIFTDLISGVDPASASDMTAKVLMGKDAEGRLVVLRIDHEDSPHA